MVFSSPSEPLTFSNELLHSFCLRKCKEMPDRAAFIDGPTERVVTYAELATQVDAVTKGLQSIGMVQGDALAILLPNVPEFAPFFFGCIQGGFVVTTMNPTYTSGELMHQFRDSGAKHCISTGPFAANALACMEALDSLKTVYVLGERVEGCEMATDLMDNDGAFTPYTGASQEDIAVIPYSSGTTGLSKGVTLSHRNLVHNVEQFQAFEPTTPGSHTLAFLPLFHIYSMSVLMNASLAVGATVITMPKFDFASFLTLTQKYKVPKMFVAPPVVVALAKHPAVAKFDLSATKILFSGAAPLGVELERAVAARLGVMVKQGYGLTETSPVLCCPHGMAKASEGSVGSLLPNTELKVVKTDGSDEEVTAPGQEGELWFRGPQVMPGYLNNEKATKNSITADGWFKTGDIGKINEEGHVFITDRLKELIKVNGFQVPPAELESILLGHPEVADCCILGVPSEKTGELVHALLVIKPDSKVTDEEVMAFVNSKVADYKRITVVTRVGAIIKSSSGKIIRRKNKELVSLGTDNTTVVCSGGEN